MYIAVTGSSGTLGRATVERLRADGHEVIGFDLDGDPGAGFTRVDLSDYGQTLDALPRGDGAPRRARRRRASGRDPGQRARARRDDAGEQLRRLVPRALRGASGRHPHCRVRVEHHRDGLPVRRRAAARCPSTRRTPAAYNTYGLGKVVEEAMAAQLAGWASRGRRSPPCASRTSSRRTATTPSSARTTRLPARPARLVDRRARRRRGGGLALAARAARLRGLQRRRAGLGLAASRRATLAARWFPGTPVADDLGEHESAHVDPQDPGPRSASGLVTTGADGRRTGCSRAPGGTHQPLTAPAARPFMIRWLRNR